MTEQTTSPAVPQFDVPDRLRKALSHAGVSSNEMAEYLEVSRHTISNWINGRTRPPATATKLWAMRCGVPYEWLAHGVEPVVPDGDGPVTSGLRDIPSGMSHDHERELTQAEILAFRKRVPLSPTDQAEIILTSAAPATWRAAA